MLLFLLLLLLLFCCSFVVVFVIEIVVVVAVAAAVRVMFSDCVLFDNSFTMMISEEVGMGNTVSMHRSR